MGASSGTGRTDEAGLRPLLSFAAAMSVRQEPAARRALHEARRAGVRRVRAEETALMLLLHAGYPAALEGLRLLGEVWPGRAWRTREGTPAVWMQRGLRLSGRVYGPTLAKLRANVAALHPDIDRWMIEQGYGRVLSRPGLAAAARELVAVTVLAATGWERQLHSHLLGALRLGNPPGLVRLAWRTGRARCGAAGRAACDRAWRAACAGGRCAGD